MLSSFLESTKYINGNYIVMDSVYNKRFYNLQKRALRVGEELRSEFPDSIDIKISNKCSYGCPFCHESSTKNGKIFNLEKTKEILLQVKKPIEIAVGGGNLFECYDETKEFIKWLSENGYRPRMTIRLEDLVQPYFDFEDFSSFIAKYVTAIGVSVVSLDSLPGKIDRSKVVDTSYYGMLGNDILDAYEFSRSITFGGSYIVFHVIAGVLPIEDFKFLVNHTRYSVLVLGFKQWGRAENMEIPRLDEWKSEIRNIINCPNGNLNSLGFDNLACDQLGIRDMIGDDNWSYMYLGDEGSCSMYIDAVEGKYARNSRSRERTSWDDISLLDFYASLNK